MKQHSTQNSKFFNYEDSSGSAEEGPKPANFCHTIASCGFWVLCFSRKSLAEFEIQRSDDVYTFAGNLAANFRLLVAVRQNLWRRSNQ